MEVVSITGWTVFAPSYQGNREAETPFTVELRPMTRAEWSRHKLAKVDEVSKSLAKAAKETTATLKDRLRNPSNFYIREVDPETGMSSPRREVEDVKELLQYAPEELVGELYEAVIKASTLEEGLKKK